MQIYLKKTWVSYNFDYICRMWSLLVILLSAVTLCSCSTSKPHCDAYGQVAIMPDTLCVATHMQQVISTLTDRNNKQPQPETPKVSNDFAYLREENLIVGGHIREA